MQKTLWIIIVILCGLTLRNAYNSESDRDKFFKDASRECFENQASAPCNIGAF